MPLNIRTAAVGPWPMNTYVAVCEATMASVLIDPGAEPDMLLSMLAGTRPVAILLTHTHPDHVGVLEEMRARLNVPLLAHPGPHHQNLDLGQYQHLADGETIQVGAESLVAHYAPGHIDDMICFRGVQTPVALVGDTLFAGGPGKTWSPAAFQTTLVTLRTVVLAWPDDLNCYPGHGPAFILGELRPQIEAFLARDHGDFYGDATWS